MNLRLQFVIVRWYQHSVVRAAYSSRTLGPSGVHLTPAGISASGADFGQ